MAGKQKLVRLSLDLSPAANEVLESLAEAGGVTKADILRRAIGVMKIAADGRGRGQRLGLADKDQPIATEIAGL